MDELCAIAQNASQPKVGFFIRTKIRRAQVRSCSFSQSADLCYFLNMRFIADLHIHSKYSRAVSKDMVPEELDRWADDKGILVIGTGDFTHPAWLKELKQKLEPAEPGLFKLKSYLKKKTIKDTLAETRFMLTVELSCIYSRGGRTRRVHHIILAPDFETVDKINTQLSWIGNLQSDGRPILGLDSEELAKIVFNSNPEAVIIPAHAWTPWFSVFGSMSGFDTLEECFGKYTDKIFAVETGLSSDPAMNWRLSKLDNIAFISNSDSHSLQRIGREANVFDAELSYAGIIDAIKNSIPRESALRPAVAAGEGGSSPRKSAMVQTIEFFPEEGKYHYDGHRVCGVVWTPEETKKHNKLCTVCGKPVTVGVMNRVDALADRPANYKDPKRVPFKNLVTLDQVIGEALNLGPATKGVKREYDILIKAFQSELNILLNVSAKDLASATKPEIVEGIQRMRAGKLKIHPGYDGEYGEVKIFNDEDRKKIISQKALF